MKTLIIYDSNFGNTQKIALILGEILNPAKVLSVIEYKPALLDDVNLLIVGSPINGWRPTEKIRSFLSGLKPGQLKRLKIASFDTRVKLFFHGDAAKKIAEQLKQAGGESISEPQGFFVQGSEGPLADGETEKVKAWAEEIKQTYGRT